MNIADHHHGVLKGSGDNGIYRITVALSLSALIHFVVLFFFTFASEEEGIRGGDKADGRTKSLSVQLSPRDSAGPAPLLPSVDQPQILSSSTAQIEERRAPENPPAGEVLADRYFTALEVDTRVVPDVPIDLNAQNIGNLFPNGAGRVRLQLWIDRSGNVEHVQPMSDTLSVEAMQEIGRIFLHSRFRPAMLRNHRVKATILIEVSCAAGMGPDMLQVLQ